MRMIPDPISHHDKRPEVYSISLSIFEFGNPCVLPSTAQFSASLSFSIAFLLSSTLFSHEKLFLAPSVSFTLSGLLLFSLGALRN